MTNTTEMAEGRPSRTAYLGRLLHELCDEIGPRPAGSDADAAGARVVLRELSEACEAAELLPVAFTRWELDTPAELTVAGRRVECYPYYGSASPPPAGLRGVLRASSAALGAYEVWSDAGGRPLALLVPSPFGPAVPRYDAAFLRYGVPIVGYGEESADLLAIAAGVPAAGVGGGARNLSVAAESRRMGDLNIQDAAPVRLRFSARTYAGSSTRSVFGRASGESPKEILIVAHADTQYCSPGANDNTASLIVLLMLARRFKLIRPRYTIGFLASAAEEIGCRGTAAYAAARERAGTLSAVKLCLNFDSLTYGIHPQITTRRAALAEELSRRFKAVDPASQPVILPQDDSLDGAPFVARGIPSIYLNSRGDDDGRLRLWHRPEDVPATVDPDVVELYFLAIVDFLDHLTL